MKRDILCAAMPSNFLMDVKQISQVRRQGECNPRLEAGLHSPCLLTSAEFGRGAVALRQKTCHNTLDLPNRDHLDAGKVLRLK